MQAALRAARGVAAGLLLRESGRRPVPAVWLARVPQRWSSSLPMNTVVLFVPQQEAWVVERMGKFHRILEPGLNFLIPLLDRIRYVQSLKEIVINVPEQSAVTLGCCLSVCMERLHDWIDLHREVSVKRPWSALWMWLKGFNLA